jgi:nucleoside-diphosphate-sugar epimerase
VEKSGPCRDPTSVALTEHETDPRARGLELLPSAAWKAIDRDTLTGRTLFLTGATGFVGRWVLAAIARLNSSAPQPLRVRALTRGEKPLSAPWLAWVEGDVRDFRDPERADLILHAALSSSATPPGGDDALMETASRGMASVAAHAKSNGQCRTVVLSSGSVYGTAYATLAESSPFAELTPDDSYAKAKREVESLARDAISAVREVVVARLFTCIGAGYRKHNHLAHVSMLDDARGGRPIVLRSDGSAMRSYLFGADLAVWILALLAGRGNDTVNVGSDEAISMLNFARIVSRAAGRGEDGVEVRATDPVVRPHFVPDIAHARARYGVAPWTSVATAVADALGQRSET